MDIKTILFFIGGIGIGGAAGVFGTRKYFQNKYQKQYELDHAALEEYYNKTDEYSRIIHSDNETDNEESSTESDSKPGGRMSSEERTEIKKKLNRKSDDAPVNYSGMYKEKNNEKRDVSFTSPIIEDSEESRICIACEKYQMGICESTNVAVNIDDTCDDFKRRDLDTRSPEEEVFDNHQKNKDKSPKIISAEAYSNLSPHIDQQVLFFYTIDQVLCDEDNEEPIEDYYRLIGDALTKYGFVDSDESIIFVMNYELETCYEIQKVDASWEDSH